MLLHEIQLYEFFISVDHWPIDDDAVLALCSDADARLHVNAGDTGGTAVFANSLVAALYCGASQAHSELSGVCAPSHDNAV